MCGEKVCIYTRAYGDGGVLHAARVGAGLAMCCMLLGWVRGVAAGMAVLCGYVGGCCVAAAVGAAWAMRNFMGRG